MSFLTDLFGGSKQQSGYALLPPEIQRAFSGLGSAVSNLIPSSQTMYRPIDQTADETKALDTIRTGFAPTESSLKSDIGMFMNPFMSSVIDKINQEANGQNSILKQTMDNLGIMGSNRQVLGANDIENTRQSNIGSMLSQQYQNAINNVFNNLIPQRQNDAQGLLNVGQFQRNLAMAQQTAPVTGLQELSKAAGILPQSGGSTQSSNGGIINGLFPNGLFRGV